MRLHYPSNETKGGPGSRKSVKALGKFIVIFPFDLHVPNSNQPVNAVKQTKQTY